jgi:hypothetical protein
MSIIEEFPKWCNQYNFILVNHKTETDRKNFFLFINEISDKIPNRIFEQNLNLSEFDYSYLKLLKLKNRILFIDYNSIIPPTPSNITDSGTVNTILSCLVDTCRKNQNVVFILRDVPAAAVISPKYDMISSLSDLSIYIENGTIGLLKHRYEIQSFFKEESILHIIREARLKTLLN